MNLRDIQYIITAADSGSFARAAELCHISQPSLSIQIKKVESRLGHDIFVRGKRGVTLSSFGAEILPFLQAVQFNIAEVNDCASRRSGIDSVSLSLGAIATVAPYIFSAISDLVNIEFEESVTSELTSKLLSEDIDAALLAVPVRIPSLEYKILYREPFYLAAAEGNDEFDSIDIDNLQSLQGHCRFVVLSEEHCLAEQVLHLCGIESRPSVNIFRATSLEVARHLVAAGDDITLIPQRAKRDDDGLKYRTLGNRYYRDIGLVYKSDNQNRTALQKLYEQLKQRIGK